MLSGLYAKWMYRWETALTTRDENRVERPLEWGFDHLADFGGAEAAEQVARGDISALDAMLALNQRIITQPHKFFDYTTPTDFRLEQRHPQLEAPRGVRRAASRAVSKVYVGGANAVSGERCGECTLV